MKKINVIDLDETLIQYDSFRQYVLIFLGNKQTSFHILLSVFFRKLRLLNSSAFKKRVIRISRKVDNYNEKMKEFSQQLFSDIDDSVAETIRSYTNSDTINILCSASPDDYVQYIAKSLGWECVSSQLDSEENYFVHMYGQKKVEEIRRLFPEETYRYNFAISDSQSDEELLKAFETSVMWEKV